MLIYKCKFTFRYYFCLPSNPSEQFYTFSCLAAWLIKSKNVTTTISSAVKNSLESTISSLNPQEYEDPNVTITAILDVIRALTSSNGQNGSSNKDYNIDFAPSKLKQGSGSEVITVLSILTEVALKASVKLTSISVKVQTLTNEVPNSHSDLSHESFGQDEDDDIEMNLEESHYTLEGDEEDDEGTDHRFVDSFNPSSFDEYKGSSYLNSSSNEVLLSQVDEATWAQEVERVLPQLKVTLSSDARLPNSSLGLSDKIDWRIRLSQLNTKSSEMNGIFTSTIDLMGRIVKEVKSTQVSLESREKYLSSQFEGLVKEYISIKEQLDSLQSKYSTASSGITSKTKELSLITDELESIKQDMEERGNKMTDGSPLVSLRKALSSLKSELVSIEIRIGVASHSILQYCIKDSIAQMAMKKGDGYLNEAIAYNSLQHSASIESTFL